MAASTPVTKDEPLTNDGALFGELTEMLWAAFKEAADNGLSSGIDSERTSLSMEKAVSAFEKAGMHVSCSQVIDMIHCAGHARTSGKEKVGKDLLFGEFCLFAASLLVSRDSLRSQACLEDLYMDVGGTLAKRYRSLTPVGTSASGGDLVYDVFLGGSCNPTTWRRDVVIPMLKTAGVTFYNPQVEEWHPELMEIERVAKDNARLMFFVIDAQTRAVASLVEVAFFASSQRPLVLVVRHLPDVTDKTTADEVQLCKEEVLDLNNARAFLLDMAERAGVKVFMDEITAVEFSVDILQGRGTAKLNDRPCSLRVGKSVVNAQDAYRQCVSSPGGSLNIDETILATRTVMPNLPRQTVVCSHLGSRETTSYQQFLCLLAELQYDALRRQGWWLWRVVRFIRSFIQAGLEVYLQKKLFADFGKTPSTTRARRTTDVFLGGSCGKTAWRQQLAIPLLRRHGVSHYNPQVEEWSIQLIPLEARAKESCHVLLFVITGETRGAASLAEAAYYIGIQRTVVLCLQDIPEGLSIDDTELSSRARKDYNRGRAYLADIASQHAVPTFDNVTDAVHCAITLVQKARSNPEPY